jgi:hypothetical protein
MNIIAVALQLVCYDPHLHITSFEGQSNILILLNMHSMQWRILIRWSGVVEENTAWHYRILLIFNYSSLDVHELHRSGL